MNIEAVIDTFAPLIEVKSRLQDLALFGGAPAFAQPLHVGRPNIGDRATLRQRFEGILDSAWLTNNGPYVQAFEQEICRRTGARHCISVCNGTIGLELAIRALGMKGEVIVPSFTFVATPHALQWQQIQPVFCDIDPETHTLDPKRVEELITPRTTGIIGVHVWGRACAPEALMEIAKRRNLKLIFDAAHAFGCAHSGTSIGNFGDAEVFSFHATKFVNCFEGGAIVTNNDALADQLRMMRNFGFSGSDRVEYEGTNGKMAEICAAMGLTSLESAEEIIRRNKQNSALYKEQLGNLPGVSFYQLPEKDQHNWQYVIAEIDADKAPLTRDELLLVLHSEQILARRYFFPGCHKMEPYRSLYPFAGMLLPHTEALAQRVLSLPNGMAVSLEEISRIAEVIRFAFTHASAIREKLASRNAT